MSGILLVMAWLGTLLVIAGFAEAKRVGYIYFVLGFALHAGRSALMHDWMLIFLFVFLMVSLGCAWVRAGQPDPLRIACRNLLAWVRERHPLDFVNGGRRFTCPYHRAIERALES